MTASRAGRRPSSRCAAMAVLVEVALEPVQHVVGRGDTGIGRGLCGADRPVARATKEHDRPFTGRDTRGDQIVDEAVVVVAVGGVPLDVHHLAREASQIRHADEAPFGARATVDQHRLRVVDQQLPGLLRRDVSGITHGCESSTASWDRSNRPSMFRPRARTSFRRLTTFPAPSRTGTARRGGLVTVDPHVDDVLDGPMTPLLPTNLVDGQVLRPRCPAANDMCRRRNRDSSHAATRRSVRRPPWRPADRRAARRRRRVQQNDCDHDDEQ